MLHLPLPLLCQSWPFFHRQCVENMKVFFLAYEKRKDIFLAAEFTFVCLLLLLFPFSVLS